MKVIFAGTSEFAVPSLEHLISYSDEVVAVITQPDRPRGRGREIHSSPVKTIAESHGIPIYQPENIKSPESIERVKSFGKVGALVVAAYGQIIPGELLRWQSYCAVNLHASLLPKYRGAAPIQHAIIAGEQQTGVTTMCMDEGLDTGDILLQETVDIFPDETAEELTQRLALIGAKLLLSTLEKLEEGTISPISQNENLATYAKSLSSDAGDIDWSHSARDIHNLIRGVTPKPGANTSFRGSKIKIWRSGIAELSGRFANPGVILAVNNDSIIVATGEGAVKIIELQPESRKRMSASSFAKGANIHPNDNFEVKFVSKSCKA